MSGRDEDFQRTMLEQLTQPQGRPDVILTIPAFNYSLEYNPDNHAFFLNIDSPRGHRYVLPFERLNFGQFIKAMSTALESVQQRTENGNVSE